MAEAQRAYMRKMHAKWREQGLCLNCGRVRVPGRTRCERCLDGAARAGRQRYALAKSAKTPKIGEP